MAIDLSAHQLQAVDLLKTGSILCGGVGSGKSRTAITYFYTKVCGGSLKINDVGEDSDLKFQKDLYIITTAKKRDTLEWNKECARFRISPKREASISGIKVVVDSWNNIKKYIGIKNAFFIFDEQRVVGAGSWVKAFYKIAEKNPWILLSATPADVWLDYVPVFVANGFYKNRSQFIARHVVYNPHVKYPSVQKYLDVGRLIALRNKILVLMPYVSKAIKIKTDVFVPFDKELFKKVSIDRWNPYEKKPIKDVSELCYTMRKVINSSLARLEKVKEIIENHKRVIIFYNFNYELEILRQLIDDSSLVVKESNGHNHDQTPDGEKWVYLVQYLSGAEGWNCTSCNAIIFYSQNYSYRIMTQAAGRIDRMDTPYTHLFYYFLLSDCPIDLAISKTLFKKKKFNEHAFVSQKLVA